MGNLKIAKEGQVLSITQGCYSSYQVVGLYEVVRDFQPMEELEEYLKENPGQKEKYQFKELGFHFFLDKKGFLKEISNVTLHLGDYGDSSEVFFYEGF